MSERDFEPTVDIKIGQTYNFLSGNHKAYDGHLVEVKEYYQPGDFASDGVGGEVLITIPTIVGRIIDQEGNELCGEICFPAVWCV